MRPEIPDAAPRFVESSHGQGSGWMGPNYEPMTIDDNPALATYHPATLSLPDGLTLERLGGRRALSDALEKALLPIQPSPWTSSPIPAAMTTHYARAHSLLNDRKSLEAFDLTREDPKLRERYGMNKFGQSCLLARRLVESGVRFINVTMGGWDTHANNFKTLKDRNLPTIDQSWSALLEDLQTRGMLEKTMVIWLGDFGRTPKINSAAGRDHWAGSTVFCMGGGGMKVGSVIGKSDANAEQPVTPPIQIEDIAATLYTILGIPVDKHYVAPDGRPFRINLNGKVVNEILA
jgi:hypothetical protein